MKIRFKIYKLSETIHQERQRCQDEILSTVLINFDYWNDCFDSEDECIEQIKNFGQRGESYIIQKEYYLPFKHEE